MSEIVLAVAVALVLSAAYLAGMEQGLRIADRRRSWWPRVALAVLAGMTSFILAQMGVTS